MKTFILVALLLLCRNIFSQTWQPMGVPEGSGVTDLVYWSGGGAVFGDKLWATTGSVDWPTGQRGGVFYSAVSGTYQGIWYRIGGSAGYYVGRTLAVGQDGNLYASLWRDPALQPADALCRFVPQAATFGLLYQAQAGDNIFSIAVKNTPHTIFAGTRNGVIRSTDNGVSFGYSNTGIPDSAWVYDIAIDSNGILAIASSKGVFISTNNGENWMATTGISPEDTVKVLEFDNDTTSTLFGNNSPTLIQNNEALFVGTQKGEIYKAWRQDDYEELFLIYLFIPDEEISRIKWLLEWGFNSTFGRTTSNESFTRKINNTGNVYKSTDNGTTWNSINDGLPANPPVSALALKKFSETSGQLYAGLFNDTTNGAGVYKLDITVGVEEIDNYVPSDYILEQNYPNPFNPNTTIQFAIPQQSFVQLEIFDVLGEKVSTLVSETLLSGTYEYEWNAEGLTSGVSSKGGYASGVYFYRLSTENFVQTKKLLLMK